MKHVLSTFGWAAGLMVALVATGTFAWAQAARAPLPTVQEQQHQHPPAAAQAKQSDTVTREQMAAAMQADDARLEELLARVHAATGAECTAPGSLDTGGR